MKIERSKNAVRNLLYGVFLKLYQTLFPFIMRTIMIYYMGAEYLGLNSLFTSILHVLNLAELGVGSAMVYSMYKPIANDDKNTICALMYLYRKYYRIIGSFILAVGLLLTLFVPKLIKGTVPDSLNVYILYLLYLGCTVLSYWLYAYKNCLLQAHQRNDIVSKVTTLTTTFQYVFQICAICYIHNYYIYVVIALLAQITTNLLTAFVVNKMYPNYHPHGSISNESQEEINKRIRDLFTSKLGGVILSSSDTIVISSFLGLTLLAVYQNYYFILSSIIAIVATLFSASLAGIGNSIIVESKEKNFRDFCKFTFLISWISGVCCNCMISLYQPFMEMWVGKELLLPFSVVICLCIYYFLYEINQMINVFKDAAGLWHEDRFRPLITAMVNLFLNLALVNYWGIYGVILSTVLSWLLVGIPWLLYNLFTNLFDKTLFMEFFIKLLSYFAVVLVTSVISSVISINLNINGIAGLMIRLIIATGISNIAFISIFYRTKEYSGCADIISRVTKGKIRIKYKG